MIRILPSGLMDFTAQDDGPVTSRREALRTMATWAGGTATFGAAASSSPSAVAATSARTSIESTFLRYDDEVARFRDVMRITRDIKDSADVLFWYHFISYVVAEGRRPFPIVRWEGIEFTHHERVGENEYLHHGHNLAFARDLDTGAFTESAYNPVTGKTIRVPPGIPKKLGPTHLLTPKGVIWTGAPSLEPVQGYHMLRESGPYVVLDRHREPPHYAPNTFMETSYEQALREHFEDRRLTSLPATTNGSFVFPWPEWMEMGNTQGHMLITWNGFKLKSIDELPREYRARAERDAPRFLQVDMTAFREYRKQA